MRHITSSRPQNPKAGKMEPLSESVSKNYMDVDSRGYVVVNYEGYTQVLGKFVEFIETKCIDQLDKLPKELRNPDTFMSCYARNKSIESGKKIGAKRFVDHKESLSGSLYVVYEEVS
ncbi:hypothetical protein JXA56_03675 [Candidatus Micrarchaeota archaeon]|nr:hypothetical protein [Candidatus Micrarchaeota archaeon]